MIETVENIIAPFQADFCDTTEMGAKTIVGAKGSGKTWIGARFVAKMVDELPGSKGIFACSTNRQTEDIWEQDIKSLLDKLDWSYKHNKNEGIVRFSNGTILHLRSAEAPGRIESIQYHWGWQDEVSLASLDFHKTIKSRIRAISGRGHQRFTSMPDDPEHFIYGALEDTCISFHEVTLDDNPDKEFVKEYKKTLSEIYTGRELDRYLYGKRVSLAGLGLFAVDERHKEDHIYIDEDPLYIVWDFNVAYRAVTCWQEVGKTKQGLPRFNCIESFQLKEATTEYDAKKLCAHFASHTGPIILHGDASGENRTAATSESMWYQIRKVFNKEFPGQVKFAVGLSNPNVKDTIQLTNWALKKNLLSFSKKANIAYRYLVAAKANKYGEIDKSVDDKPGGAKTHEVDTIRYLAWLVFERYFPGTQARKLQSVKLKGF